MCRCIMRLDIHSHGKACYPLQQAQRANKVSFPVPRLPMLASPLTDKYPLQNPQNLRIDPH